MGVPRDQIPAIPFVVGKVAHAKTQRRKGGTRMCSVLVSLRLERSGREESIRWLRVGAWESGFQPRPSVESVRSVVWVWEMGSRPAPRGGTRPSTGSSQRPVARYQRRRSGNWRLGTGISTCAAWGHAAFNREFPDTREVTQPRYLVCHVLGSGNWRLGTGNPEKTGFQGGGSSVGCAVRGR